MTGLNDDLLGRLFLDARTMRTWTDRPVHEDVLRHLYELARWPPTSANCQPMRIVFVRSPEAKERLRPALSAGNVDQTMSAPVTAIVAYDTQFFDKMAALNPDRREMGARFAALPEPARERVAFQSGTLQGGYLILAARALGLDCGPMGGFERVKVDEAFFPDARWRSNFLLNLGYGDPSSVRSRAPRLDFDEACRVE